MKAAIGVFGRQGFKKTSVEDIAEAAQLSKQGLYLHFAGKNEIFSAALFKYLDDGLKLVDEAILNESTLYNKILSAMEHWFGRHMATFSPEGLDVIETGNRLYRDEINKYKDSFKSRIVRALNESKELKKGDVCSSKDIAETLYLCGLSWKDERCSPADFRKKMGSCVRVCCRIEK